MVDVTQAHAQLLKDPSIQFRFPAVTPPPAPPHVLHRPRTIVGWAWAVGCSGSSSSSPGIVVLLVAVQAVRNRGAPGRKTAAPCRAGPARRGHADPARIRRRPAGRRRPRQPGRVWRRRPRPAAPRRRRDRQALPPHAAAGPHQPRHRRRWGRCRPRCAPPSPRSPPAPNAPCSPRRRSGRRIGRRRGRPMPACSTRGAVSRGPAQTFSPLAVMRR